jgi:hypothetical protein
MKTNSAESHIEKGDHHKKALEEEKKRQDVLAELKLAAKPFIEELHVKGFKTIHDIDDLLRLKKMNKDLVKLVLTWIPRLNSNDALQEILVRSLAVSKTQIEGAVLIDLFDDPKKTTYFKWAVGNTIACATLLNIQGWLENKLKSIAQPMENQMLMFAAIKYFDNDKARKYLRALIYNHPLQVAGALAYIGNSDDLEFLETKLPEIEKKMKTSFKQSIKKLQKKIIKK